MPVDSPKLPGEYSFAVKGYHFDHPIAPERKKRKHALTVGIQDTRLQKSIDDCFNNISEVTDSDVDKILSNDASKFVKNAENYYIISPWNDEATIVGLISTAKILFELQSGSITMTFRRFVSLAPFFMGWICKRTSFTKAPGNSSFSGHYMCKMHSAKSVCCEFKVTLRINFDARTVIIDVRTPHNHDYTRMITNFPASYLRTHIENSAAFLAGSAPTLLRSGVCNSLGPEICDALALKNINKKYFRNIALNDPVLQRKRNMFGGIGDWNEDIILIANKTGGLQMHYKVFNMAGSNAVLIANANFFGEMVKEKRIVMMDATYGVCGYSDAKLISIAYRDKWGETRVGVTALARPKAESFEVMAAFLEAVFLLAKELYGLSEREAFSKLTYFLIDESAGEEKAVNTVFNRLGTRSRHVKVLYCQWHMTSSFARKLGNTSEAYKVMHEAVYSTSEDRFNALVNKTLSLLSNNVTKIKYIKGHLRNKEKWAGYFRAIPVLQQIRTTQRIESIHSRWKNPPSSGGFGVGNKLTPVALADRLASYFGYEISEAQVQIQKSNSHFFSSKGFDSLDELIPRLREKCRIEYNAALKYFQKEQNGLASPDDGIATSSQGDKCVILIKNGRYSCRVFKYWGLPCRHMFLGALKSSPSFLHSRAMVDRLKPLAMDTYEAEIPVEPYEPNEMHQSGERLVLLGGLREIAHTSHSNVLEFMESDGNLSSLQDYIDFSNYVTGLAKKFWASKAEREKENVAEIFQKFMDKAAFFKRKWTRHVHHIPTQTIVIDFVGVSLSIESLYFTYGNK